VLHSDLGHRSAGLAAPAAPELVELRAIVAANLCVRTPEATLKDKEARCNAAAQFLGDVLASVRPAEVAADDFAPAGFMLLRQAVKVAYQLDKLGLGAPWLAGAVANGTEVAVRLCMALPGHGKQIECGRNLLFMLYRGSAAGTHKADIGSATHVVRQAVAAVHALPALSPGSERSAAETFQKQALFHKTGDDAMSFAVWAQHVRALPQGRLAARGSFEALRLDGASDSWALGPLVGGLEVEYKWFVFAHKTDERIRYADLKWRSSLHSVFNPAYSALAVTSEKPIKHRDYNTWSIVEIISGPVPVADLQDTLGIIGKAAAVVRNFIPGGDFRDCAELGSELNKCVAVASSMGAFTPPPEAASWKMGEAQGKSTMLPGPAVQISEEWNLADFPHGRWEEPWSLEPIFGAAFEKVVSKSLSALKSSIGIVPSVGHGVEVVFRTAAVLAQALPPQALLRGWAALALWGLLHDQLWESDRLGKYNEPTNYKNSFLYMPNTDMTALWRYVRQVAAPGSSPSGSLGGAVCAKDAALAKFPHAEPAGLAFTVFARFLEEVCRPGGPSNEYLQEVSAPFAVRRDRLFTPRCAGEVCYVAVESRGFDPRAWGLRLALADA